MTTRSTVALVALIAFIACKDNKAKSEDTAPSASSSATSTASAPSPTDSGSGAPSNGGASSLEAQARLLVPATLPGFTRASVEPFPIQLGSSPPPITGVDANWTATNGSGLRASLNIDHTSEPIDNDPDTKPVKVAGHNGAQAYDAQIAKADLEWRSGAWRFILSVVREHGGSGDPRTPLRSLGEVIAKSSDAVLAKGAGP